MDDCEDSFNSAFEELTDSCAPKSYSHNNSEGPVDYILLFIHGASFSSQLFDQNLKDFHEALSEIDKEWFWELNRNYHLEIIDWKHAVSTHQYKVMNRISPTGDIDSAEYFQKYADDIESLNEIGESGTGGGKTPNSIKRLLTWINREEASEVNEEIEEALNQASNIKQFERLAEKIGIRAYICNVAFDILYHMNPRFGNFMAATVVKELNARVRGLRNSMCGRFKNSEIILVGHSLGSIILYEILSGSRSRPSSYDATDANDKSIFNNITLPHNNDCIAESMEFTAKHAFLWGSPLGAYMAIKNQPSLCGGCPFINTAHHGTRLYNIFNRHDPIAARIEPILYNRLSKLPPPVQIQSYFANTLMRKGIGFVKGGQLKHFAKYIVNRMLNQENKSAIHDSVVNNLLESLHFRRRYKLPDPLNRTDRYGNTNLELTGFEQAGIKKLLSYGLSSEALDDPPTSNLIDDLECLELTGNAAWSLRQLALNICRKLRTILCRYCDHKIKVSRNGAPPLDQCLRVIDVEISTFLENVTDLDIYVPTSYDPSITRDEWLEQGCLRDLDTTKQLCRQELTNQFSGEFNDTEEEGGNLLPSRMDFCARGQLHHIILAPLGLLQSHLKYWSCKDTVFFMLRQITGVTPQLSRDERDAVMQEAQKCRQRAYNQLSKLFK